MEDTEKKSVEEIKQAAIKKKKELKQPRVSKQEKELETMENAAKETPNVLQPPIQQKLSPQQSIFALDERITKIAANTNTFLLQLNTAVKELQLRVDNLYEKMDTVNERIGDIRDGLKAQIQANSKMIDVFLTK